MKHRLNFFRIQFFLIIIIFITIFFHNYFLLFFIIKESPGWGVQGANTATCQARDSAGMYLQSRNSPHRMLKNHFPG